MRTIPLAIALLFSALIQAQVVHSEAEKVIKTGKDEVTCLAIAPRGDVILVGTANGAYLFDIEKGKKVQHFEYGVDGSTIVYYAAFNENGEYIVLIGYTGKRWIYEVKSGKKLSSTSGQKWIPDPRETSALGFNVRNSDFDRFYQQLEANHPTKAVVARAGKKGRVDFLSPTGEVMQSLEYADNKDQHHRAPCYFGPNDEYFITGTDNGQVLFYKLN